MLRQWLQILILIACNGFSTGDWVDPTEDRAVAFYHVFSGPFNNTDGIVDEQILQLKRSGLLGA